ncbi:uncharacterized protein [Dermacentor albipictus]|uniref:uncharacterized protein n=1 Tax=Dermacentor albipictus TaxID=60249 RepID=UPI0031FC7C61
MPEEYLLLVDGHVVAAAKMFKQAFRMLFAAYCCFHICYAEKASCTLEFIQRCTCMIKVKSHISWVLGGETVHENRGQDEKYTAGVGIFGINPDRGRKGKKGNVAVSKKVLALVQRITECEWNVQGSKLDSV